LTSDELQNTEQFPSSLKPADQTAEEEPAASATPSLARRLSTSNVIQIIIAFVVIMGVMSFIQFSGPAILDNDGYYHIRWSRMLADAAPFPPPFKALPLTTLNEDAYADHHYLFHVMLIPFALGDMRAGAKWAAVIFSSLGITSLFALLVLYRVPYRWLWLAPIVASSEPFLYRLSMTRAPALSLALLGVGAYLILKRKLLWLAILSFLFVWSYSLFPLILVFAAVYTVSVYLAERRIDIGPVAACAIGLALGLVINPYFPENITLFRDHLIMKMTARYSVDVGIEWYPYESWTLLSSSGLAFVIFTTAVTAFDWRSRFKDIKPLFFLIIAMILLVMSFKSRRFIEYWPPFAIVFAAFTFAPKLANFRWPEFGRARDRIIAYSTASLLAVASIAAIEMSIMGARAGVKSEADPEAYKGAAEWIAGNVPKGSVIFNTDWDDFPMLFYYNPDYAYVVGLDPTYLYDKSPELWRLYEKITLGRESDPAPLIRDRFGAKFVFTDNEHTAFLSEAEDSKDFEIVYQDADTTVLKIISPYSGIHLQEEKSNQDMCCWERRHLCPPDSHSIEIRCRVSGPTPEEVGPVD